MVEANVDSWPKKSASLPRSKNSTNLGKLGRSERVNPSSFGFKITDLTGVK